MTMQSLGLSWGAAGAMVMAALIMVLTPGPNMIYLVSRSIGQGRGAGLVSLLGTGVGFVIYMTMANLGLAAVFVVVPWLYVGLKAAGVVFLAWLAWNALRPGGAGLFETRSVAADSGWKLFRMGLLTNLLNPKTVVMYLALIPQFIDPARGSVTAQGFTLGSIQITVSLIVNASIVFGAAGIATFLSRRPAWTLWQRRLTGGLLAMVAALLAKDVPQAARP